jgi:hypothetical protein
MCSLKTVFLACYSVKYDVRLVLNASTSSIFYKFGGKLFQSLMVRTRKEAVFVSITGCLYISEFLWVILPGCPVLLFYIIWDVYRYLMMKSFVKQA